MTKAVTISMLTEGRPEPTPAVLATARWGRRAAPLALGAAILLGSAGPAMAQQGAPTVSREVVQALPSQESLQLTAALSRLGRNPRDVEALIDAGDAARAMGDVSAAIGFFTRAEQISANNPRVKAGLAGALVQSGDPFTAIPLFDQAVRAGADPATVAGDRGLAYDLVGDPGTAQRYYQLALGKGPDDAVSRRLAISLAISGQGREVEKVLLPFLQDQDKAAWRAKAFSLAIQGNTKEAVKITRTLLPPDLAEGIQPYLEYMPQLTRAQQAAAANLGKFPRASEIGRDDPRVAQFAPVGQGGGRVATVGQGLIPKGEPLGTRTAAAETRETRERTRKERQAAERAARRAERVAPPEPKPTRSDAGPATPELAAGAAPASAAAATPRVAAQAPAAPVRVARSEPAPAARPAPPPAPVAMPAPAQTSVPSAASAPAVSPSAAPPPAARSAPAATPGFDLASLPQSRFGTEAVGDDGQAARPAPASEPSFADAFGDLGQPTGTATPVTGAVDIRTIEPARSKPEPRPEPKPEAKPAKAEKPAPPSHPSRIWVQVGIGQDRKALSFDWKKFAKKAPDLFKGRGPFVSDMGRTNRMLAGPFESQKAANAYIAELEKAGFDGPYVWTSPAGQVVDAL